MNIHVPSVKPGSLRSYRSLKVTVFVDERAIIVQLRWVLWSQRVISRSKRYLQISRWQFGADSSIILEFTALRVKARGDGPLVL